MGTALARAAPAPASTTARDHLGLASATAVALSVTTFVAVTPGGWSPFVSARWWCVSTLTSLLAAQVFRSVRHERVTLLPPVARRAWYVVLAALTIAAAVNDDVPTAVLGEPSRHLGLVTWVLCALAFACGAVLGGGSDGHRRRRTLAWGLLVAVALAGAWCIVELLTGPPIDVAGTTDRLLGPFGSAAYLGAACCLGLPATVGVAADRSSGRVARFGALLVTVAGVVAVVGSGSRAAWFALAAAAGVAAAASHGRAPVGADHHTAAVGATVGAAAAIGIGVFVAAGPGFGAIVARDHGASSRIDEWRVAIEVLSEHPAGVGPEGYRIAIADGVDGAYERQYDRDDALPDRAHSGPLDVALAGGVAAGLAWLVLQVHLARRCWRALRRGAPILGGLAAGVLAYGIAQLLLFPIGELDPLWWLVAGCVIGATAGDGDSGPVGVRAPPVRRIEWVRTATAGLAAIVAVGACIAGVAAVAADRLAGDAIRHATSDPARALRDAERAVRLRPDDTHLRLLAASTRAATVTLADIDRAIGAARAAQAYTPHDPEVREVLGMLLIERAVATGALDDVAASVGHWRGAVAVDPHRADWQIALGQALALADDAAGARAAWERAAALDPDDPRAPALLEALVAVTDGG